MPIKTGVDLTKDQIDAIAVLGYRAYEQGRYVDARNIFEGLTALDENLYYGYAGLGAIDLAEEKLDEAGVNLRKATELNPKDATVLANLGEVLLRQGKFKESAEVYQKALDLDPGHKDGGVNRARAILQGMELVLKAVEDGKATGAA